YSGILAVLLIVGLGIARVLLWAREIRFFVVALVACLVYALGWYTPIFRLMYEVLPGVDLFRRPADATFLVGLMIAVNTGYLVHRLLCRTAPARHSVGVEIALIVALVAAALAIAVAAGQLGVAVVPIATGIAFAAAGIALIAWVTRLVPTHPMLAAVLLLAF